MKNHLLALKREWRWLPGKRESGVLVAVVVLIVISQAVVGKVAITDQEAFSRAIDWSVADELVVLAPELALLAVIFVGFRLMNPGVMVVALTVAFTPAVFAEEELKDPRTRDDDISGTIVEASVSRLPSGVYEYIYRIAAPETNKGSVRGIKIALACDIDFGEIAWPEPPDPVFQGDHSTVPHVPVQMYIDPEQTSAMSITARGEAYWGLAMDPGEAGERYRMLSPAPPALRRFVLEPSWRTTGYDYGSLSDDELDTVPWIGDFRVTGMIEAPACKLPPEPDR